MVWGVQLLYFVEQQEKTGRGEVRRLRVTIWREILGLRLELPTYTRSLQFLARPKEKHI